MILDRVDNACRYAGVHPRFADAIRFLVETDPSALPEGRVEIDGDSLYAILMEADGKGPDGAPLEAHRAYIDIQATLTGTDTMGWSPLAACRAASRGYDPERDLEFFDGTPATRFEVAAGSFAVFFPEDAHAPLAGTSRVRKIVVKIAV